MTVISLVPFLFSVPGLKLSIYAASLILLLGIWFTLKSINLYINTDDDTARKLMFSSFLYLPIMQIVFVVDRFLS